MLTKQELLTRQQNTYRPRTILISSSKRIYLYLRMEFPYGSIPKSQRNERNYSIRSLKKKQSVKVYRKYNAVKYVKKSVSVIVSASRALRNKRSNTTKVYRIFNPDNTLNRGTTGILEGRLIILYLSISINLVYRIERFNRYIRPELLSLIYKLQYNLLIYFLYSKQTDIGHPNNSSKVFSYNSRIFNKINSSKRYSKIKIRVNKTQIRAEKNCQLRANRCFLPRETYSRISGLGIPNGIIANDPLQADIQYRIRLLPSLQRQLRRRISIR